MKLTQREKLLLWLHFGKGNERRNHAMSKDNKPQWAIELTSIGHYLNPQNGFVYPILSSEKPDSENFLLREEIKKDNGISEADWITLKTARGKGRRTSAQCVRSGGRESTR